MSHLVDLGAGWSVWKWVLVRGAGFPAAGVAVVSGPDAARAADVVLTLERDVMDLRREALAETRGRLSLFDGDERRRLDKAVKVLVRNRTPAQDAAGETPLLARLHHREAELTSARSNLQDAFSVDADRAAKAMRALAASPRFREAVTWQNRQIVGRAFDWILTHDDASSSRAQQNYQTVARYLQRYSVKNDSAGFFGPIGFGRITSHTPTISVTPSVGFVDKRTVYFEHWCIDAIAQVMAADPEVLAAARPRRMPTVRLLDNAVQSPDGKRSPLPPVYTALLRLCDGRLSAREIAAQLVMRPELDLDDEEEVFGLLHETVRKNLCIWTVEVTTVTEWPERALRAQLAEVSEPARSHAIAMLDELESRRADITAARGDPEALGRAMSGLDATFERLTAQAAQRSAGKIYAARTLVHEDTRRALDLELGQDLVHEIAPTLALFLTCARWLSFRIATQYRRALDERFTELSTRGDAVDAIDAIDFLVFWQRAKELFPTAGPRPALILSVIAEMQAVWAELLQLPGDARIVRRTSADLAGAVRERFAAPHPGWPGARYHSPDLLISAPDLAAIQRGERTFVLGEFHMAVSTFAFADQKEHEERAAIVRARELDLPMSLPMQVTSKETVTAADHAWVSGHDVDIEIGTTRSWRDRDAVIQVADLEVRRDGDALVVRDRVSGRSYDIIAFFNVHLSAQVLNEFHILAPAAHVPRLMVDDFVVVREQWRIDPSAVEFAAMPRGSDQFLSARRWAATLGLPPCIFVKVPEEPKPVFIDLASATFVEMLAKLLRNAKAATLSEMVPAQGDTWLPDAEGQTYTSELRLIAVDPEPWRPPAR